MSSHVTYGVEYKYDNVEHVQDAIDKGVPAVRQVGPSDMNT